MKIKQLKVGFPYKFNNKLFEKSIPECYGIDRIDANTLLEKNVLIFSDIKYFYSNEKISNVFLGLEGLKSIGIYMKDFKHCNGSIYENYNVKLWYVNLNFFNYLEESYALIQEEMEI